MTSINTSDPPKKPHTAPSITTPSIATVGCGYFSRFHHEAWSRLPVKHLGVCDLEKSKAIAFSDEFGVETAFDNFEEMLDKTNPDLVDIILPPEQHLEHIRLALEFHAHVLCQKPFTENTQQAQIAADLGRQAGRLVIVHENFRFQPWYRKIKTLLQEDLLGRIYQAQFKLRPGDGRGPNAYLARQPYFQTMPQFLIRETGIHFVDVFRYLFGEPKSLFADLTRLNPAITGEDAGIFILEFDDQLRAAFDGNRLSDHSARNPRLTLGEMQIEGEKGTLTLNGNGELWFRRHGNDQSHQIACDFYDNGFGGDCVYELQKHVVDCLESGKEPENLASEYVRNLAIQTQIYESSALGKKMHLAS